MVPVEQLNKVNFLNVYYLASEIKHEMEMSPDPSKKATITDHIYQPTVNPVYGYPYFSQVRVRTFTYLNSIGAIVDFFHSESYHKIHFTPIPQDEFFAFCGKLARIYWERFPKPSEHETNAKSLSDEQASKLKLVLDTIAFKLKEYGDEDELDADSLLGPITIPYNHFSSSLEPFDINGLLYKLANDFHLIMTPKSDAKVVSFDFPMTSDRETFYKFKSAIDKRCSAIVAKKQTESAAPSEEKIMKVMLVGGSKVSVEKPEEEKKYRFPYKLPRGTKWENITIKFLDDDTVQILTKGKEHSPNFKDMGFEGKGGKPSVLWIFLRVLAMYSGEIKASDDKKDDSYKKQKQSLSEALESYFGLDFDPFHPFQTDKSYRVKFTLLPPENGFTFEEKKKTSLLEKPVKNSPFADLDSYMNDVAPVVAQKEDIPTEDER